MKTGLRMGLVLALLASSGCATIRAQRLRSKLRNTPAPNFQLTSTDGRSVQLSDFHGKPVLLAFFAVG